MAHHKRKKAKYARGYRAGMGMVKPWKMNGATRTSSLEGEKFSDHKRRSAFAVPRGVSARA